MVLIKNLPTSTINTLENFGGEVLYNASINHPIVNVSSGFKKFVLSTLDDEITGISGISATNITGTLQTAAQPNVTSLGTLTGLATNGNLTIGQHNGSTTGLVLGNTLVTATGAELNYVDTTPGTAQASKALVVDENLAIVGIHNIETDNLTVNGTLVTASAIELNYTDVTTVGVAQANKALVLDENLDIVGIHNLETDNLTVNGTLVTSSAVELNYVDVNTLGVAEASKALVVDANRDISNIRNLYAENLNGTIQTAAQPNITSLGTLTNLDVAGALNVGSLEIDGVPLTPADVGGIRVRVFSSNDFNGRIIKNDVIENIDFTDYEPDNQTENYSMEIWGYIKPNYSEDYTFSVTANDHFRLWINNQLVKTNWSTGDHTSVQTNPMSLVANKWYPIYIQHRQDTTTQRLVINWQSTTQTSQTIPQSAFAYDNKEISVTTRELFIQNSMTFYDINNGHQSSINVNSSGDMILNSYSDNVNIVGHDGATKGLMLNETLVTSTATELNYVDTTPGAAEASKALVLDSSRNITNINNIVTTGSLDVDGLVNLNNVTDATNSTSGALVVDGGVGIAKKLYVGDDTSIGGDLLVNGPILSIPTGNTASRPAEPQAGYVRYNSQTSQFEGYGAGNAWGSLGGVSDVDQDTKILAEDGAGTDDDNLRFFNAGSETMRLTSTGTMGLGTNAPDKQLEINSSTGDCLRLTHNDANGSATNYVDFSVSSSGNLTLNSSGDTIFIHTSDNLDITGHNGSSLGLKLNGTLVTSTATELNYVDTTPGAAEASKALVLDSSRNITNINNIATTGALDVDGLVNLNNVTDATNSTSGALVVDGGVGIAKKLYVGDDLNVTDDASIGGTLVVTGASTLSSTLDVTGLVNLNNVTDATNSTSGALVVDGGVGIAKQLYVGDDLNVTDAASIGGTLNVTGASTLSSTLEVTGAAILSSTLGVTGATTLSNTLNVSGISNITNTTDSSSISTGAFIVAGGMGIAKKIFGGSDLSIAGNSSLSGTLGVTGATILSNTLGVTGATSLSSTLNVSGNSILQGSLGVGTSMPDKKVEINSSTGDCLRLTYNDNDGSANNYVDLLVSNNGQFNITPSSGNINITSHNGSTTGLKLNNVLVTSTADELNYVDISNKGVAEADKALVVDSSRNIVNINYMDVAHMSAIKPNSSNNTIDYPISLIVTPNTTASVGLGTGIEFNSVNSNNDIYNAGYFNYVSTNITNNSETGYFDFKLANSGVIDSIMTVSNNGVLTCTSLVETSDMRVKENIQDTNSKNSLDQILKVNVKTYNFIKDSQKKNYTGLIAQELHEIIPDAVVINKKDEYDDFHSIHYTQLIPHLINCIKELNNEITELKKNIN